MKMDVLLGLQWGDEGKGKIVDVLTPEYLNVARFQGGPNAGHTLEFNGQKHVLHLIPSGIFNQDTTNIIGNGVVLDPVVFTQEVHKLIKAGVDVFEKLVISRKVHLILPTHRVLDAAQEKAKGNLKIGSTLRGIGPAYTDKVARQGLRIGDIESDNFKEKYEILRNIHLASLEGIKVELNMEEVERLWFEGIELLKRFQFIDGEYFVNQAMDKGESILAEGAQGTLLDIDFGSYPFVTSSNTVCAGACTGLGVAPGRIGEIYGIFKAYCTRVGSGPFPTELDDDIGQLLRDQGQEYGSTTGRPRRCGWLDLVALKYTVMLNGVTKLIMTKADVFTDIESIKVASSYVVNGELTDQFPFDSIASCQPVYTELPGWKIDISDLRSKDQLPRELSSYIRFIEKFIGVPITIVSVGPDREATILM
ncbi:MAG: adenylosuccinate synthase [Bacteroidales bacterium]|nr:adenylosuccinate synthase [Bacteroidales bacterium]